MEHQDSPAPEDLPAQGVFCTLVLVRKKDGSEISRFPVDGETTTFGRSVPPPPPSVLALRWSGAARLPTLATGVCAYS